MTGDSRRNHPRGNAKVRALWVVVFLILTAGGAQAQIPSQLRRTGLNGPVRTIRSEFQQYSGENSQWESRGDVLHDVTRYDRNGRCLTSDIDPGSGWRAYGFPTPPASAPGPHRYELVRPLRTRMGWKTVWHFDDQDRLERFEAFALYPHGAVLSNWQHYTYDSQGRVVQLTYWADWGWSPSQTKPYPPIHLKYWFDDDGRIAGWSRADDPTERSTLTYDEKGRLVKQVDEDADGNIRTQTWDAYDEFGNWIVRTNTHSWRRDDGDEPQSREAIRRTITYHGPRRRSLPGPH